MEERKHELEKPITKADIMFAFNIMMQLIEEDSELRTDSQFINENEPKYYTIEFPQELRLIFDRVIVTFSFYMKRFQRESGGKRWLSTQESYTFLNAISLTMHLKNSISLDYEIIWKKDKVRSQCPHCKRRFWTWIKRYDEQIPVGQLLLGDTMEAKVHFHVLADMWSSECEKVLGMIEEYEEEKQRKKFKEWQEKYPKLEKLIKYGDQIIEHEQIALNKEQKIKNGEQKTTKYEFKIDELIRKNAKLIDEKLKDIRTVSYTHLTLPTN